MKNVFGFILSIVGIAINATIGLLYFITLGDISFNIHRIMQIILLNVVLFLYFSLNIQRRIT